MFCHFYPRIEQRRIAGSTVTTHCIVYALFAPDSLIRMVLKEAKCFFATYTLLPVALTGKSMEKVYPLNPRLRLPPVLCTTS